MLILGANYKMNILTTKEFEQKVQGWKIYSRGGLNMSPYTNVPFECGCGKTHKYNNIYTPPFMDNHGNGQMCLMVKECKYLNAVELKGTFNIDRMQNLFSCKFEEKKERYGFTLNNPKIDDEINIWIEERWNLGK